MFKWAKTDRSRTRPAAGTAGRLEIQVFPRRNGAERDGKYGILHKFRGPICTAARPARTAPRVPAGAILDRTGENSYYCKGNEAMRHSYTIQTKGGGYE